MRVVLAMLAATALACGSTAGGGVDAGGEGDSGAGAPDLSTPASDAGVLADSSSPAIDAAIDDAGIAPDASADASMPVDASAPIDRSLVRIDHFDDFALDEVVSDANGALILGTGHDAHDPYAPGSYHAGNYYNGGDYRYGVAESPVLEWSHAFDEVVPSFEVTTPEGTWLTIKLRARMNNRWTKDYVLGVWAYDDATIRRHSVDVQADADGDVFTDTLALNAPADALQLVAVLLSDRPGVSPVLRALAASAIDTSLPPRADPGDPTVYGTTLAVPGRSQMIYPEGGEVWCSPTSTSMLLAYWSDVLAEPALNETVPNAAAFIYDFVYDGTGNWPFNTAHATSAGNGRLHGFVTRFDSFAQVERLIAMRVPVAISISYQPGQLAGSPIRSTAGHLIVVKGFASNGDVVANDPAFDSDATVEVAYDRSELDRAWTHSNRTAYVLHPNDQPLPADPLGAY